jgi:hypothetical protein
LFQDRNLSLKQVHKFNRLPPSLLRLLVHDRVFKIGSNIKGDLTRIKRQFSQLEGQVSFNVIDLKDYCISRGIIKRKESGSLDALAEKLLGSFLSKDPSLRKCEDWELPHLPPHLIEYAALDVHASQLIFNKASETVPLERILYTSPPGTRVAICVQEDGEIAAYGKVAEMQPSSLGKVRVRVPSKSRLVIDVETLVIPSAAAILHLQPVLSKSTTKAGTFTFGQIQAMAGSFPFQVVAPISLLLPDPRDPVRHDYFPLYSSIYF